MKRPTATATGRCLAAGSYGKALKDSQKIAEKQLTTTRAKLLEEVKRERKVKRINSYGVDQNGRVTVRVGRKDETGWSLVTSSADLQRVIADPAPLVRRHQSLAEGPDSVAIFL